MDYLNEQAFSWWDLFVAALLLTLLYWLLQLAYRILDNHPLLNPILERMKRATRFLLAIFEPGAVLILLGMFVMISPLRHGLAVGILLAAGFSQVRNYVSGKLIQVDDAVRPGKRMAVDGLKGIIAVRGRLGLKLRTRQGLHFINYNTLLDKGYQLLPSEEIGGYYHLALNAQTDKSVKPDELLDMMATSPYLDWNHRPVIDPVEDDPQRYRAKVLVRDEGYLHDFIALLEEQGFATTILKK